MVKRALLVSAVALLAVASFAQGGGQRGFGRGGGNMGPTSLLGRDDVQKELKITDGQKTKLTELGAIRGQRGQGGQGGGQRGQGGQGGGGGAQGGQGGGQRGQGGQGMDPEEMRKRMAEREKTIMDVLEAGQRTRLRELWIQRVGNAAVLREDVQTELKFTTAQKDQVKALQDKQREVGQALREKMMNQEITREEMMEASQKNQKTMNDKLGEVLTAEQKEALKKMGGAAFKFDEDNGGL